MTEGRIPPNDLDAEAAVLSAVFLDAGSLDRILPTLQAEHFYSDANRRVYTAQVTLHSAGKPLDVVTVRGWLADHEELQRVGGVQYLVFLTDAVPAIANIETYAKTIREKWRLRQLIATCQRVAADGYQPQDDTQAFIDGAEQEIYSIARTPESSTVQCVKDVVEQSFRTLADAYERGQKIIGTPTGFMKLDRLLGGLHGGELIIVAARPGMGKTSWALSAAQNIAKKATDDSEGASVAIFSLEMPKDQLVIRMMCSDARVDLTKLRTGEVDRKDWAQLTKSAARIAGMPLWIDDASTLSILDLRAKVRRIQAQSASGETPPVRLVIVDYLQLMTTNAKVHSREQQISELSRGLKLLAKDLSIPVMAVSQLNRAVETRGKDKRPQLSDLRESGAIEQDADTVVFVYRDDYYDQENPEVAGLAELIIAKQRNGPTGTIKVRFTKACTRFDNLADEYDDEPAPPPMLSNRENPNYWQD